MPKNAVQRLQEIEKDINTVISLYEVANKSKSNNDKPETSKKQNSQQLPQVGAPKQLEAVPRFDKFREVPGHPQTSVFDPFKKASSILTRPSQGLNPRELVLGKKWTGTLKPGSAPSSSSTISTVVEESDYGHQQSLDPGTTASDRGILAKAKTAENLSSKEWYPCSNLQSLGVVMTPSKTLQTAKEILEKNNFTENEGSKQVLHYEKENCGEETVHRSDVKIKKSQLNNSKSDMKSPEKEEINIERSRSVSLREEVSVQQFIECNVPVTSKSVITAKVYSKKEKSLLDIRPALYITPMPKLDQKGSTSSIQKNPKSTASKHIYFRNKNSSGPTTKKTQADNANKTSISKTIVHENTNEVLKNFGGPVVCNKPEDSKSFCVFEKEQIVQFSQVDEGVMTNQVEQIDDSESWVNELSKIVDKSNEKLEKMKVSKELALDIAKHFKEKFDEIQKSKGELLEKLQMVEKKNERLNTEVEEARESKKKLKQKIEGLKEELTEETQNVESIKSGEINSVEIDSLKAKLCETESQYNAKLFEKNKKIEEIQMDRLVESRNALKNQEILGRKIQRLTKEKCELLSKFDEIRRQLQGSQSTTKILEENIRQLEEEVQKQKQHLKIKTETLHETNRELEMIRLNCTDLDDQVKMLRKSMEEFDGIQHSLIKKTTEYEQQIKSNQEKIKELQDENIRLKDELQSERDGLRIKVKIIEDQQETIRQLKEKSEDAKTLLKTNQSLERVLNIEREEKLELQEAVERLKWRKEELKKKVKTLENDFLLAPQEVVRDLQKTQIVLHELENQVQMKQKEWELQLYSLMKEKQQACSVAEFATKKLMETTSEFQKQSEAYKSLQRLVAGNLAAKERQAMRETGKKKRNIQKTTAARTRVQNFPYLEIFAKKKNCSS